MEKECEHELFNKEEHWINEDEVIITEECSLCKAKFQGILKRCQ